MTQITACFSEAMSLCLYGTIIKKPRKERHRCKGLDQTHISPNTRRPWDNTPVKSLRKGDYIKLHAAFNIHLGCNLREFHT